MKLPDTAARVRTAMERAMRTTKPPVPKEMKTATLMWHPVTGATHIEEPADMTPQELHHLLVSAARISYPIEYGDSHALALALAESTLRDLAQLTVAADALEKIEG